MDGWINGVLWIFGVWVRGKHSSQMYFGNQVKKIYDHISRFWKFISVYLSIEGVRCVEVWTVTKFVPGWL